MSKGVGSPRPDDIALDLGPVAVDPCLQGKGIGGVMLSAFCERMDGEHALSYMETDKIENVGFYEKFGFRVTGEAAALGIPNWFMSRPPSRWLSEQHLSL